MLNIISFSKTIVEGGVKRTWDFGGYYYTIVSNRDVVTILPGVLPNYLGSLDASYLDLILEFDNLGKLISFFIISLLCSAQSHSLIHMVCTCHE